MREQQGRTNVTNRLNGSYQAQVVNVSHPDGIYMASIRLIKLWDAVRDGDLPWAEFLLPIGAKPSNGHVLPVEPGDYVWVDFPRNGDTRYPRITGSLYYAPDLTSYLPDEVNGTAYEPKRAEGEPKPAIYDRKDYLYDRFGLREHRTASGGYSLTHKATGTAIEVTSDGQMVIHTEGNAFESATGNKTEQYTGKLTINVKGDAIIKSDGAATVEASADLNLVAGGNVNLQAGGNFAVIAAAAPWKLG
jgi:hypothetical protein